MPIARVTQEFLDYLGASPEEQKLCEPKKKRKSSHKESAALTKAIIRYLESKGCIVWRENSGLARALHGSGYIHLAPSGTPDVIGMLPDGQFIGVEVKVKRDAASDIQLAWHKKASEKGAFVIFARSVQDVEDALTSR